MKKLDSTINHDFTKEDSKKDTGGMKAREAVAWIKCQLKETRDIEVNDKQLQGINHNALRLWYGKETGIKSDLKKGIKIRQRIVEGLIKNLLKAEEGHKRRLMDSLAIQVMYLSKLEARWRKGTSKIRGGYEAKDRIKLIIE